MNKQAKIGNITVTANTFYNGHVDQHVNPYGVLVQNGEGVTDHALVGTYLSFVADGPGVRSVGLGELRLCGPGENFATALATFDLESEARQRLTMYGIAA